MAYAAMSFFLRHKKLQDELAAASPTAVQDNTLVMLEGFRLLAKLSRPLGIVVGAIGIPVFLAGVQFDERDWIFPGAIMSLAGLTLIPTGYWLSGKANRLFREKYVLSLLTERFENLKYDRNGRFGRELFQELRVMERIYSVDGNDWIEADYKGIHFVSADCRAFQTSLLDGIAAIGGNAALALTDEGCFNGRIFHFRFARSFGNGLQIITPDFMHAVFSRGWPGQSVPLGWERVETELYEFNRYFDVYAPAAPAALEILKPQVIEAVALVRRLTTLPLLFCFKNQDLYLFIDCGRDMFDLTNKSGRSSVEEYDKLKADVATVTAFLDTMYLKGTLPGQATAGHKETGCNTNGIYPRGRSCRGICDLLGYRRVQ